MVWALVRFLTCRAIVVTVATGSVKANTVMNTMRQYILFESKVAPLIYGHSIRQSPFLRRGMLVTDPTQFIVHLDAFIPSGHVLLGLHGRKEIKFILLFIHKIVLQKYKAISDQKQSLHFISLLKFFYLKNRDGNTIYAHDDS